MAEVCDPPMKDITYSKKYIQKHVVVVMGLTTLRERCSKLAIIGPH